MKEKRLWSDPRDGKRWLVQTHFSESPEPGQKAPARRLVTFQHPAEIDMSVKELKAARLEDGEPAEELSDEALMRLLDEGAGGGAYR